MVSGDLLPFAPSTNNAVMAMAAIEFEEFDEVALVIGGNFTNVNGEPRTRIAVLDEEGNVDDFNPGADNTVNAIVVANGQVYVGGAFSTVAGQPRKGLASFSIDEDGTLTDWDPVVADGSALVLEPGDGVMYVGGSFNTIGGAARSSVAAIDVNTGAATAFNANLPPGTVLSLKRSGSTLYVGDLVHRTLGTRRGDWRTDRSALPALQPAAPVRAVAVQGNTLYVGGGLFNLGAVMRRGLGGIDLSQSPPAPTTWNPDAGYNVNAIYAYPDVVVAVGNFNRTNPVPASGLGVWERTTGVPAPPVSFQGRRRQQPGIAGMDGASTGAGRNRLHAGGREHADQRQRYCHAPTWQRDELQRRTRRQPPSTCGCGQRMLQDRARRPQRCVSIRAALLLRGRRRSSARSWTEAMLIWIGAEHRGNVAGYLLEVGSATGLSNILTTPFPESTSSLSATAPPGTYFVRVKATNSCGAGAPSSELFFTIGSSSTFPESPENLTATVSGSNVSLSWTAPSSGSAPTG